MRSNFFKAVFNFMNVINNRLLVNYLLFEEGRKMYKEENVNYDSDLKIDRELPLYIYHSLKNKHLVHLLNTGNFTHRARYTILLSLVLSKDFNCSADTDAGDDVYSRTSTCDHLL